MPDPSAAELARFLEQRGDLSKPWNLQMLRLQKLKEEKEALTPEAYVEKLQDALQDLMRLGRFWEGREAEVFGERFSPEQIEPLPGSGGSLRRWNGLVFPR